MRVYLAGPITGYSWAKASRWRKTAKKFLEKHGILVFDPLEGTPKRNAIIRSEDYSNQELIAILQRDFEAVKRADVVIFNFSYAKKPSVGSLIEFGWAEGKKRVIIPAPWADLPVILADAVTDSLEDALWWTVEQLNGEINQS